MKPSHVKMALTTAIKANRTLFIHGSPGVGKSQVVRGVADELGFGFRDVRLAQMDPVDLRGLPMERNGSAVWAVPDFLPRVDRDGDEGILFLDELSSAAPAVQVAGYQLVLDRAMGEYRLPPGWRIIAAGNKATDRAVVQKLSKALGSRFTHVSFEVDFDDFMDHALQHDFAPEVLAFLRYRPALLHDFDPASTEHTFPCPRTWEFVSDLVKVGVPREVENEMFKGTVGEGPAAEFVGFLRVWRNLTDPAMILMSPQNAPVPKDPAALYATCGALARMASPDNFERVTTYVDRLPAEFGVLLVQDAAKTTPTIQQTRAFLGWASKNRDVLV